MIVNIRALLDLIRFLPLVIIFGLGIMACIALCYNWYERRFCSRQKAMIKLRNEPMQIIAEDKLNIIEWITRDQSKGIMEDGDVDENLTRDDIESFITECRERLLGFNDEN